MKTFHTPTRTAPDTNKLLSERIRHVPRSFIREILKVAVSDDMISFAGGLPNEKLFPVEALQRATAELFASKAGFSLQYSTTEGYLPLREYIAEYYRERHGLTVDPGQILITTGSQQALDLIGKVLINEGDQVVMEAPGYLGAIQAFSLYRPRFLPVALKNDGMDPEALRDVLSTEHPKLMYAVPQFQNPSGISYSGAVKEKVAEQLAGREMLLVEDNPYMDLRFSGEASPGFFSYLPGQTIMLGTFSKIAAPGLRLGWMVAEGDLLGKLVIAKQAADLHSSSFNQVVLHNFLTNNNLEDHLQNIRNAYGSQCQAMISSSREYFPEEVRFTRPEGGMFMWCELPQGLSSMKLFEVAIRKRVAFVPGNPFYTDGRPYYETFRLNFSCSDPATIREGIRRIAESISEIASE